MAATPQIRVVQALNLPQQKRRLRRPVHRFNVKAKPYEICPTVFAPVLPGETMTNLLLQSRAVSDPIKEPLIGWHYEHYFFYVGMPALQAYIGNSSFVNLFIDDTLDLVLEGQTIAQGRLVAVGDHFGICITEVATARK